MTDLIRVHVTLDFEVTDEMELREAGFRAYRDRWASARAAAGSEIDAATLESMDEAWATPQAAIVTLLSGVDGPLRALELPGVTQRGSGIGNPQIIESAP